MYLNLKFFSVVSIVLSLLSCAENKASLDNMAAASSLFQKIKNAGLNRIVHFTHIDNLKGILDQKQILSASLLGAEQKTIIAHSDKNIVYTMLSPDWLIDANIPPVGLGISKKNTVAISLATDVLMKRSDWTFKNSWGKTLPSKASSRDLLELAIEKRFAPKLSSFLTQDASKVPHLDSKTKADLLFELNHELLFEKQIDLKGQRFVSINFSSEAARSHFLENAKKSAFWKPSAPGNKRFQISLPCSDQEYFNRSLDIFF